MSSHVSFVEQKFDHSCDSEAGRCLYGMHSGRNKDDGFVGSEPDYFLVAKGKSFGDFKAIFPLMRRDDYKIQDSSLIGFIEEILAKKDLLVILKLLVQGTDILPAFLVAVGVGEGEFYTSDELIKHKIEFQH